jgi:hypothetical protein
MYRSCIFCSAALGSNESIERFPVGRTLAFDAQKGRLWAVCPRCARWNLAPIEERWEAIEEAERLFRDTRMRVQSENIGLAKLRDGTRLVRVGQALRGELAAWRYGETLARRRTRHLLAGGVVATVGGAGFLAGMAAAGVGALGAYCMHLLVLSFWEGVRNGRVVHHLPLPGAAAGSKAVRLVRQDLVGARLVQAETGGIGILLPRIWGDSTTRTLYPFKHPAPPIVTGEPARALLARAMVHVNERGARRDGVDAALRRIAAAGSPGTFLENAARARRPLVPVDCEAAEPLGNLAIEMALHEETERRALEGELAMLQGMWREAEEIAAIADRLPELPASEPPRLDPVR